MDGYTLFDTALGRCAIAWGTRGIAAVALPERDERALRARIRRASPDAMESAPPADVRAAIDGIVALLDGEARDLSDVAIDIERVPEFNRRVYEVAREVPPGETTTYGEIAQRLGEPRAAQAVGQALGSNPIPIVVPCHRVLAAGGALGGFSARGGVATKRRMLAIEGALAPTLFAWPGSTDSRGASSPWITARTDRPSSEGNHPEDARPIVPDGAHDNEASTDDRWIQA